MAGIHLNLTPAGSTAAMLGLVLLSLLAELAAERVGAALHHAPAVDPEHCRFVCHDDVERYSITECVCRRPGG